MQRAFSNTSIIFMSETEEIIVCCFRIAQGGLGGRTDAQAGWSAYFKGVCF